MHDVAFYKTNFERNTNDRYFTEHWCTEALLNTIPGIWDMAPIYEPFAGRGDIIKVISKRWPTIPVYANDIDLSDFDFNCGAEYVSGSDFFADCPWLEIYPRLPHPVSIITNPPYDRAETALRVCLEIPSVKFVAMLLRSEFDHAAKRTDLFLRPDFAGKLVLTSRPRWDQWWDGSQPKCSPRHNFAWYIFSKFHQGPARMWFAGKNSVDSTPELAYKVEHEN